MALTCPCPSGHWPPVQSSQLGKCVCPRAICRLRRLVAKGSRLFQALHSFLSFISTNDGVFVHFLCRCVGDFFVFGTGTFRTRGLGRLVVASENGLEVAAICCASTPASLFAFFPPPFEPPIVLILPSCIHFNFFGCPRPRWGRRRRERSMREERRRRDHCRIGSWRRMRNDHTSGNGRLCHYIDDS